MNPKAFICHASEDKERFVIKFAEKLCANGVDAWLDQWDLLPGDELPEKIFEEGIGQTDSIIIILSNYSNKPWVRKELNTGITKRIEKGTKIIPVVLDECEIPECLRSIVRVKIHDCNSYKKEFDKILSSILGTTEKPKLGTMPQHMSSEYKGIEGLAKIDNLILKDLCEYAIEKESSLVLDLRDVLGDGGKYGISYEEARDSIIALGEEGYINVSSYMGGNKNDYGCHIRIDIDGFLLYADAYMDNYEVIRKKIISAIVNEDIQHGINEMSTKIEVSALIVKFIFLELKESQYIKTSESIDENMRIYDVSPRLKRLLQE